MSTRQPTDSGRGGAPLQWLLAGGVVVMLMLLERRRPLRKRVENELDHSGRNVAIGALGAVASLITAAPLLPRLVRWARKRRIGLMYYVPLPRPFQTFLGVLLLDYTLYIWHRLNHRHPFFWRFHLVHHVDLDLDASTGLRFHFGELALSTGFRAVQLLLTGANETAVARWQQMLVISVVFHHSNLRLDPGIDRAMRRAVVTPRMHGIHHSIIRAETESNFSSLFTWWDWLHRTFREDVPQEAITIGVPAFQNPETVTLAEMLVLPFRTAASGWEPEA